VKILAVSDKVMEVVYSPAIKRNFGHVELVIACGDLPFYYLEFIASSLDVPCFFVFGNHDVSTRQTSDGIVRIHPPGWINLDSRSVHANGLLLAGLEGSLRYRPDAAHQYSQNEAYLRALRLLPALFYNRLRHGRYLDIMVAHAPPLGINDGPDYAHKGFAALLKLMDFFGPRYLLHGHKHVYGTESTHTRYGETQVINVYPYRVLDIPPDPS
jgi:Icc-related predicted phosphoesterase